MAEKLTKARRDTLAALATRKDGATAYDIAEIMFGERYGIIAARARGRLYLLKRDGLAVNDRLSGLWFITPAGLQALTESKEAGTND